MREQTRGFSVSKTFLLGFGFLGVSVVWAMYNAYVPVFLKTTFALRSSLIGAIMPIDNVLAIALLPFLGALSDRTRTRLSRRRPYILVGSALAEGEDQRLSLADSARGLRDNLKDVFAGEKSLLFVLLSILFWFVGFNSLETFFTTYARFHLGIKESTGAMILGFFSVTFMVTSVVSGLLGSRRPDRRGGLPLPHGLLRGDVRAGLGDDELRAPRGGGRSATLGSTLTDTRRPRAALRRGRRSSPAWIS